jgi:hexosaminidase
MEKCYSFEPTTDEMTAEEAARILGVQANLWTEYIATESHLQYMLLPRLAALSEVQWCNKENKNWDRFYESADEFCAIYETMGYTYATHIFDTKGEVSINKENGTVEVRLSSQGDAQSAQSLLNEALNIAKRLGDSDDLLDQELMRAHELLA